MTSSFVSSIFNSANTFVISSSIKAMCPMRLPRTVYSVCSGPVNSSTYAKYDKEFYSYPAAKTNHHAFEAGLAFHTATMVRLANAIGEIYPQLNKSLLYAGIMLHDLAKVLELTGPEQTEYTVRGNLIEFDLI